ncbi:MAG TPA: threonine--tRNA ligase, partial [Planctomycetota bacterium]|nr:threonine--tRNA ligase [Planctomycetota bacterium]
MQSEAAAAAPRSAEEGPFPLATLRHSVAHLMASAVERLYPGTKFGFGPAIEHGFYYDLDVPQALEDADLRRIEKEMRKIAARAPAIVCTELSREAAVQQLRAAGQDYKVEAVDLIPEGEAITFHTHDGWSDLCEGPHIDRFDRPFAFKLLSLAGAYWRGDERRPMLQRIYGTAFWTEAELEAHLAWLEEVKARDHRRLGTDLDLFSVHPEAGAGFVFWHPRLGVVRKEIEDFWWAEHRRRGYQPVYSPHVARETLFAVSGHLENYADLMYAPMAIDETPYRVKPMNCPGHILIYQTRGRSYRELPLRWAELGTVYRYEKSGVVHGMLRVRGFTQDDSHIFCTPEQLPAEIAGVLELVQLMLTTFGFEYTAYLATRPAEKSIGAPEVWDRALDALRQGAAQAGIPLELDEGGGAFYGPKIDFKVRDALGREWQNSTVQCDFNLPERFDLVYTAPDGTHQRPIMVHRAVLGSLERFVGGLIEHYAGRFPFWLAPEQVAVIPIREEHADYARTVADRLVREGFRVDCLAEATHMNKRIKHAQSLQVPFLLVVGEREAHDGTVAVRPRGTRDQDVVPLERFVAIARELQATRALG